MIKNIGANWTRSLLTIIVTLVLIPFTLGKLGERDYGIWVVLISTTGYLSLMMLGVPMAAVRYLAQYVTEKNEEQLRKAVASCGGLYLMMGVAALVVSVGLHFYLKAVYASGEPPKIGPDQWPEARLAFWLMAFNIAAGFFAKVPYGLMAAHHDFVTQNLVLCGSLLVRFVLTLALLSWRPDFALLAVVLIACQVFEYVVSWRIVHRRYGIRFRLADFDSAMVRRILSFSVFIVLLGLGTRLALLTDAQVIGGFLPPEEALPAASQYEVANNFLVYLLELIIGIAGVVMPMATHLKALGRSEELQDVFLKWSKLALTITLPVALYLGFFGGPFVAWFTRKPHFGTAAGPVLVALMASAVVFMPVRGVALPILMGLGKIGAATVGFLIMGVVNLALSIALVGEMGILGVALGTAIPNVAYAMFLAAIACREIHIPMGHYLGYVAVRPLLAALPLAGLLWLLTSSVEVSGFWPLLFTGAGLVAVFAVLQVLFVFRGDPYLDLYSKLPGARRA